MKSNQVENEQHDNREQRAILLLLLCQDRINCLTIYARLNKEAILTSLQAHIQYFRKIGNLSTSVAYL